MADRDHRRAGPFAKRSEKGERASHVVIAVGIDLVG
jgi:hypothetical protein